VADVINLSLSGNSWGASLSASSLLLSAGESADVQVTVAIPADASGEMDVVTVTATSQGSGGTITVSTDLTTIAETEGYILYLPFVTKP
jgi:uncharacterized membrane protein